MFEIRAFYTTSSRSGSMDARPTRTGAGIGYDLRFFRKELAAWRERIITDPSEGERR